MAEHACELLSERRRHHRWALGIIAARGLRALAASNWAETGENLGEDLVRVVALIVPGERDHDHAVVFREQRVHAPIVREMPAAQREVSPSVAASRYPAALQPSPFKPEIAASYARRSVLFNEAATRATVSTTKTECAIPCARQAGWSLPSANSFRPWRTLGLERSAMSSM